MSSGASSRVLSPSSLSSSFQFITADRHSETNYSSEESFSGISDASSSDDDEIVWSVTDELSASVLSVPSAGAVLRSPDMLSDEEFIVLSPSAIPPTHARQADSGWSSLSPSVVEGSGIEVSSIDGLSDILSNLNVDSDVESVRPASQATTRRRRRRVSRGKVVARVIPPATTAQMPSAASPRSRTIQPRADASVPPTTPKRKKKTRKAKTFDPQPSIPVTSDAQARAGLGERPIVDDVSEVGETKTTTVYEEAAQYISAILSASTVEAKPKSDLTFLQALIIELGVLPAPSTELTSHSSFLQLPSLPRSLRAAKNLVKSSVFLNVRDYLDVREKGLDALRKVMHPSRKALIKDLTRGQGKRKVPRNVVKNSGLGVLLVTCH